MLKNNNNKELDVLNYFEK